MTVRQVDTGTAYGMAPRAYNKALVEVGPGTPMGELMRRYWQPCALSEDLTSDKPRKVKLLGEDLILFRDRSGRPGLVHEHCAHRGTSLYYGRIEDDGIRCCYHGWKFDVQGHCLDQPCEVDRGAANRHRVRQPWYPVEERYGLVYAYMGPPEKKPVLPRWAHLENLEEGERIFAVGRAAVPCPPSDRPYEPQPYNWLAAYENMMDSPHVPWLHYHHSGDQFAGTVLMRVEDEEPELPPYAQFKDCCGNIVAQRSKLGVTQGMPFPVPGHGEMMLRNECIVPNMAVITAVDMLYFVPTCDTEYISFMLVRTRDPVLGGFNEMHGDKTWHELTDDERRDSPGDREAQSSIGELPAHNYEHLSPGDVAVVMIRRRLEEATRDVAEGRDPPGVSFSEDSPPLVIEAHGMLPYQRAS